MFYELNNLVGKVLIVGVLLVALGYGVSQFGGWCQQYRDTVKDAKQRFGEVERFEFDGPSVDEVVRKQQEVFDAWQRQQQEQWRDLEFPKTTNREGRGNR